MHTRHEASGAGATASTIAPPAAATPPLAGQRITLHDGHRVGPLGRAIAGAGGSPLSIGAGGAGAVVVGRGQATLVAQRARTVPAGGRAALVMWALVAGGALLAIAVMLLGGNPAGQSGTTSVRTTSSEPSSTRQRGEGASAAAERHRVGRQARQRARLRARVLARQRAHIQLAAQRRARTTRRRQAATNTAPIEVVISSASTSGTSVPASVTPTPAVGDNGGAIELVPLR